MGKVEVVVVVADSHRRGSTATSRRTVRPGDDDHARVRVSGTSTSAVMLCERFLMFGRGLLGEAAHAAPDR